MIWFQFLFIKIICPSKFVIQAQGNVCFSYHWSPDIFWCTFVRLAAMSVVDFHISRVFFFIKMFLLFIFWLYVVYIFTHVPLRWILLPCCCCRYFYLLVSSLFFKLFFIRIWFYETSIILFFVVVLVWKHDLKKIILKHTVPATKNSLF